MRTLLAAIFLAAASCSPSTAPAPAAPTASAAPAVPVYSFQVVNTYPHDRTSFTQGLQYVDGVMYESTGMEGASLIRRYDLATGAVQAEHKIDQKYFGEGSVVLPDKIVSITWKNQKGFIFDRETLAPKGEFTYEGEGWGLTTDGQKVYMSDGTSQIRVLDPATLQETSRIDVTMNGRPVAALNELEFIKGEIWANVFEADRIVRIDPATGKVNSVVYLANLLGPQDRRGVDVLNGIAYDQAGDRIFVTGKYWPKIFEIKLVEPPGAPKPN